MPTQVREAKPAFVGWQDQRIATLALLLSAPCTIAAQMPGATNGMLPVVIDHAAYIGMPRPYVPCAGDHAAFAAIHETVGMLGADLPERVVSCQIDQAAISSGSMKVVGWGDRT